MVTPLPRGTRRTPPLRLATATWHRVPIRTGADVAEIVGRHRVEAVELNDGSRIELRHGRVRSARRSQCESRLAGPRFVHSAFTLRTSVGNGSMTSCRRPYNQCLRKDPFVAYQAEYIWLDGTEPTAQLRSKTKIIDDSVTTPPIWGFDGSSTNQATGDKSDCVLKPVFTCPDPASRRTQHPGAVRGAAGVEHAARTHQHPRRRGGRRQEVRRRRHVVRPRAGVHDAPHRRHAARLPRRRAATPARRGRTTAASAPTRSSAATSSRSTPRRASTPASRSPAPTPR